MIGRSLIAAFLLLLPIARSDQPHTPELEAEVKKIDTAAADSDAKPVVAAAVADHLKVHRNHLVLLRKQTGRSYGQIFVSTLEANGAGQEEILRQARALNREIEKRLRASRASDPEQEQAGPSLRPALSLSTAVDHNSVGTFYSLVPQVGIESRNAALVVGAPYYSNSGAASSAHGIGDVYAAGFLSGNIGLFELGAGVTAGFPTGDRSLGLSAGKVTYDGVATVARPFQSARLFLNAGVTNSVFSNVGYQRPYVTDGSATHFSGGLEVRAARRLILGGGGFAVRPAGAQVVFSRVTAPEPPPATSPPPQPPGGGRPPGRGRGTGPPSGVPHGQPPVFDIGTPTEVAASELRDHGANVWGSLYLHPAVSLNAAVARSVPFRLTTVRVGLGFDVARLLFPGRRF